MVRITLVPGWRRIVRVAAGAAALFILPAAALGGTIRIGGENYDFNPPTGLCFLDPERVAEDRTAFDELDPGGDRLKLAAVFADCGQLDTWRADPRARVKKFGRILIDWEKDDPSISLQILDRAGTVRTETQTTVSTLRFHE